MPVSFLLRSPSVCCELNHAKLDGPVLFLGRSWQFNAHCVFAIRRNPEREEKAGKRKSFYFFILLEWEIYETALMLPGGADRVFPNVKRSDVGNETPRLCAPRAHFFSFLLSRSKSSRVCWWGYLGETWKYFGLCYCTKFSDGTASNPALPFQRNVRARRPWLSPPAGYNHK